MSESLVFELPVNAAAKNASGNPFEIQGRLLDLIRDKLLPMVTLPSRDEVLAAAAEAFDKYIAAIDIPYIPNVFEPMFDQAMKQVFLQVVGRAYDAIAKAKSNPVPA